MKRHRSVNRVCRIIWSKVLSARVAVAGTTRVCSKSSSRPLVVAALSFSSIVAQASPIGGQVVSGSGTINQAGSTTTITQSTQNLSLNWKSFNIAKTDTVNFVQPGASSIAVNRIFDTNGTQILGHLNANGQVWLINPNGILFGAGSQVNVGGLVASTLDNISSNGQSVSFSGSGTGSIVNQGMIVGHYVAFIGNTVSNVGTITSNLGAIAMGAGNAATLTFAGNDLVKMQVDRSVLNSLAANGGLIKADGGMVIMSAGAKNSLLASVVNNTGVIEAQTVQNKGGNISLLGGMSAGTVNLGGTLDASAPNGGNGGFIETSADNVHIAPDAKITTLAAQGLSGTWLIDPQDFTIASSGGDETGAQLSSALSGGNVTILSSNGATAGSGNINVNDVVSWGGNTLTLTAADNVNINAVMTASGSAGLALNPATSNGVDTAVGGSTVQIGASGVLAFGGSGGLTFPSTITDNGSLQFNQSGNFNYAGVISGSGTLTHGGVGVLTLAGTNTYSGGTIINGGALAVANDSNLGAASGNLTLNGGTLENTASFTLNRTLILGASGGTLQTDAGTNLTLANAINSPGSLAQTGSGALTVDNNINTGGTQTYQSAVTLGNNVTLTASNVSLAGGVVGGTLGLTIAGNATLGTTSGLSYLQINGSSTLNGNVTTNGAQTYTGAVTLGANATLSSTGGGAIGLLSTVDGAHALTVNTSGATNFGGAIGGTTGLTALTTDASGTTTLGGNVTTSGAQNYNDAVTLGANATLSSTGGGAIGLLATVDGAHALTLNTLGTTTFGGAVGSVTALTSLTTDAGGTTTLGGNVTSSGAQTYSDAVTLGVNAMLSSTGGGAIGLLSTVDGAHNLTVNTGGLASFGGAVGGGAALSQLSVTSGTFSAASTLNIGSGGLSVNTSGGGITQSGAFVVAGNSNFNAGANGITLTNAGNDFGGAVSLTGGTTQITDMNALTLGTLNTGALTVTSAGNMSLAGNVAAAGNATLNSGGVLSLGARSVTGAGVTLNGVGITQSAGSTVDGGSGDIMVNGGGGAINLDGSLITTSNTVTATTVHHATTVALGNITTGNNPIGASGTTILGIAYDITGVVTQNPGTYIHTGTLTGTSQITKQPTGGTTGGATGSTLVGPLPANVLTVSAADQSILAAHVPNPPDLTDPPFSTPGIYLADKATSLLARVVDGGLNVDAINGNRETKP